MHTNMNKYGSFFVIATSYIRRDMKNEDYELREFTKFNLKNKEEGTLNPNNPHEHYFQNSLIK